MSNLSNIRSKVLEAAFRPEGRDLNPWTSRATKNLEEDILCRYESLNKKVSDLFSADRLSSYSHRNVSIGGLPDVDSYENELNQIKVAIQTAYRQAAACSSEIVNNFNDLQQLIEQVEKKINRVRSLISDFKIYATYPVKGITYVGDSFQNASKIETNSDSLSASECHYNEAAGYLALPLSKREVYSIASITINSDSNGYSGNNNEYGVPRHGDLSDLIDSNPDTWFEYERIGSFDEPLTLSLSIKLKSSQIVNNITVVSMNFGTKTWPTLVSLETSVDGREYQSITTDSTALKWGERLEDSLETFGGSSQASSSLSYIFTPRRAQYIRLLIQQSSSYIINTAGTTKERKAIGLRDIEIAGMKFEEAGELVSRDFVLSSPVGKVAVAVDQFPLEGESVVGKVSHYVSTNNGQEWTEVSPIHLDSSTVSEIVDTGVADPDGVVTLPSTNTLKYKVSMSRKALGFQSAGTEDMQILTSEFYVPPATPPYVNTLSHDPVEGTITVVNPLGGEATSCVKPSSPYYVGMLSGNEDELPAFTLPFNEIDSARTRVKVGEEEWKRVSSILTFNDVVYGTKVFQINPNTKQLLFGDGSGDAERPPSGLPITLWFNRERVHVQPGSPVAVELMHPTTGIKEKVEIYREGGQVSVTNERVKRGHHILPLENRFIVYTVTDGVMNNPVTILFQDGSSLVAPTSGDPLLTWVPFIDGYSEFADYSGGITGAISAGCYTVDPYTGHLYVPWDPADPTNRDAFPPPDRAAYISYSYTSRVYVPNYRWEFGSGGMDFQTIEIAPEYIGYESYWATPDSILDNSTVWNMGWNLTEAGIPVESLVPKSLIFYDQDGDLASSWTEVPYINGVDEFDLIPEYDRAFWYSVDYKRAVVYSAETPIRTTSASYYRIRFQFSNYYAEYAIGLPMVEGKNWNLRDKNKIEFTDSYALDVLSIVAASSGSSKTRALRVQYKYVGDASGEIKELEEYYTPILSEYRMIAAGTD